MKDGIKNMAQEHTYSVDLTVPTPHLNTCSFCSRSATLSNSHHQSTKIPQVCMSLCER